MMGLYHEAVQTFGAVTAQVRLRLAPDLAAPPAAQSTTSVVGVKCAPIRTLRRPARIIPDSRSFR